ncbi:10881_t:CDS:10 [Acaulospora morrowiae]|uniref:peptidyl-tRNA hydrolase n=1 Tax=Acaulospora morrowiae TaxID=94023 RepID=A0A9N8YN60_9GLOM|nr:10881_t:CDS:10 [Acaulospora morrowiae]
MVFILKTTKSSLNGMITTYDTETSLAVFNHIKKCIGSHVSKHPAVKDPGSSEPLFEKNSEFKKHKTRKTLIYSTRVLNFVHDVTAVALGIRVAHLVDFAFLTLEETRELIASLRRDALLSTLFALQFSETHTFICNRYLFFSKLDTDLSEDLKSNIFVDVSCGDNGICGEPKMTDAPPLLLKELLKTHIHHLFLQFHKSSRESNPEAVLYFSETPSCIIAFAGWILEYTVIYVLDTLSGERDTKFHDTVNISSSKSQPTKNCLGNKDLRLYRVFAKRLFGGKVHRHLLLSFSFPCNLTKITQEGQNHQNVIYDNCSIDALKSKFNSRLRKQSFWDLGIDVETSDLVMYLENQKLPQAYSLTTLLSVGVGCLLVGYFLGTRKHKKSAALKIYSENLEETKLVLVVRTDLGMSKGKVAAQFIHNPLDFSIPLFSNLVDKSVIKHSQLFFTVSL